MGLFGKRASDDEWLKGVKPFYVAARTFVRVVNDAVTQLSAVHQEVELLRRTNNGRGGKQTGHNLTGQLQTERLEEDARSLANICINLASVARSVRALPSPTSTEARHAKASLIQALRIYLQCARRVSRLLHNLGGEFGSNYLMGGVYETKWTALETASVKRAVDKAGQCFEAAARFLDSNPTS
jgi:hypothetical protein